MNDLIQLVAEKGLPWDLYTWICDAGLYIGLAYSLFHGKKLGIKLWKLIIILAVVYGWSAGVQSAIWSVLTYIKEIHWLGIQTAVNSIVRTFVFIPIIAWPLAKIFKYKWSHICDAIVMLPLLRSAIAQLACVFTGCCRGYECSWGIYNIKTQSHHFPTPILETILTLIIFAYLVYRTVKKKFVSDGKLYPLMMIMYGIMRFICEMLRDNEKIFLGSNAIGLHAAFMVLVGILWLYLPNKYAEWQKARAEKARIEKEKAQAQATNNTTDENCNTESSSEELSNSDEAITE